MDNAVYAMDTSTATTLSPDASPEYVLPSNSHSPPSHLLPDAPAMYQAETGTMHVLGSPPSYLDSPDTIDPSAVIYPTSTLADFPHYVQSPTFENDISVEAIPASHSPHTPPDSQMAPAHHVPVGLSYVGSTSSLQSALKPVPTPARSRANTVGSYVGESPRIQQVFPAASGESQNPLKAGSALLEQIAQTAESANQACKNLQVRRANTLLEDLKSKISYVSDLIANFSEVSLMDGTPHGTPIHEGQSDYFDDQGVIFHTTLSDRKRCLSTDTEERRIKSLKSEPQDHIPLFPSPPAPQCLPQSPPPSRPHTPTFAHTPTYPNFHIPPSYSNGYGGSAEALLNSVAPPTLPLRRAAWSESIIPSSRHAHSLSASSIPPLDPHFQRVPSMQSVPIGRMTRSGSINGTYGNPFSSLDFSFSAAPATGQPTPSTTDAWKPTVSPLTSKGKGARKRSQSVNVSRVAEAGDSDEEDANDDEDGGDEEEWTSQTSHSSSPSSSSDVPQEYRADVDRIFFQFLNRICSNLESTDPKGDNIHQTLMAKKMQRLDESPDFRPFKFRIAAFTNAFLDELARQGFPEEKIPMKRVRNYLWKQPHILRYNEDGKKAKSKGNHIWNVEAKKAGKDKWEFRPFYRRLAGNPPSVAYCGIRWVWAPRVWDPQVPWPQNVPISFTSPRLPSWLSWDENNRLSGVPPPDAVSCEITVDASFILDGQEGHLSHTFTLNVAPAQNFSRSSSLQNLTEVAMASQRVIPRPSLNSPPPPLQQDSTPARVASVLQNVAMRVAEETTHVQRTSPPSQQHELGALVQQSLVLEHTIEAYDQAITGFSAPDTKLLATAIQAVVVEAAQTAVAPLTNRTGRVPSAVEAIQTASVNDMSVGVHGALATAVKMGASSEVALLYNTQNLLSQARIQTGPAGLFPPMM